MRLIASSPLSLWTPLCPVQWMEARKTRVPGRAGPWRFRPAVGGSSVTAPLYLCAGKERAAAECQASSSNSWARASSGSPPWVSLTDTRLRSSPLGSCRLLPGRCTLTGWARRRRRCTGSTVLTSTLATRPWATRHRTRPVCSRGRKGGKSEEMAWRILGIRDGIQKDFFSLLLVKTHSHRWSSSLNGRIDNPVFITFGSYFWGKDSVVPPLLWLHVLTTPTTVIRLLTIVDCSVVLLVFTIVLFIILKFPLVFVSISTVLFIMALFWSKGWQFKTQLQLCIMCNMLKCA